MEEIWKDIPNYEGYQASNWGRIRTHNKITHTILHGDRHWKDRILKPKKDKQNTLKVSLWKDNKEKTLIVARLVGSTFLEDNINTDLTINHKDGNRLNNNVDNLEWMSRADNIKYGFENNQYAKTCKKCKLIRNGEEHIFNSMSKASLFLGKSHKYLSMVLKRGSKIYDSNGREYIYKSLEE